VGLGASDSLPRGALLDVPASGDRCGLVMISIRFALYC